MLINKYSLFCISSYDVKSNLNKNTQEKLEMIAFHPVNTLIIKSETTQTEPSPRPFTSPQERKYSCPFLYAD